MSLTFEYVLVPQRSRPVRRPPPVVEKRGRSNDPERIAKNLALGHRIQDMYDNGELVDLTSAAIRLKLSASRVSQMLVLTQLPPGIQEGILLGTVNIAEMTLRKALLSADWNEQRAFLKDLL